MDDNSVNQLVDVIIEIWSRKCQVFGSFINATSLKRNSRRARQIVLMYSKRMLLPSRYEGSLDFTSSPHRRMYHVAVIISNL